MTNTAKALTATERETLDELLSYVDEKHPIELAEISGEHGGGFLAALLTACEEAEADVAETLVIEHGLTIAVESNLTPAEGRELHGLLQREAADLRAGRRGPRATS